MGLLQAPAIVFFCVGGLEGIQLETRISVYICYFTKHLEEEQDSMYFYCLQCSYNPKMHKKPI